MSISAKVQLGSGGIANYNEWELVYNASTQPVYKTYVGLEVGQPEDTATWHTPNGQAAIPVEFTPENKQIRLTMDVLGDDWDAIIGSISALKRAIKQAQRACTGAGEDKVRVALLPDGGTYTTYYNVMAGTVDDSGAYYTAEAVTSGLARQVVVLLTVEPFGYGDSFTLKNYLASSPHFIEGNTAGVGDGWAAYGTPTTLEISDLNLIGGHSQKVTSDSGHGVATDVVTAAGGSDLVDYVWVYSSAMSGFQMSLRDGSNNAIQSVACTVANADKTAIDSGGRTWYRYKAAGQNTTAANARLSVTSTSAGKVFYVDVGYLRVGTQTAPPAFSSTHAIKNRYDPSIAEANINYLDVWGIPGDAPALVNLLVEPGSGDATRYYLSAFADGKSPVTDCEHWHDTSGWSTVSGTWTSGTGTINNHFSKCTTTAGVIRNSNAIGVEYSRQAWRVFAFAYTTDLEATIQVKHYAGGSGVGPLIASSSVGVLTATSKWQIVDLGTINIQGILNENSNPLEEEIHITQASTEELSIDGIMYMPTQLGWSIAESYDYAAAPRVLNAYYDAGEQSIYDASTYLRASFVGNVPLLIPGNVMNRYIFIMADKSDSEVTITTGFDVTLTVTPRTSHLLGVA